MQKLLIITGASKGIGYATAQLFQEQHWSIVNLSRHPCALPGVHNLTVDLQHPDWASTCQQQLMPCLEKAQQVCVVHNAAFYEKDAVPTMGAVTLRNCLEVNVVAPSILNQLCLPTMLAGSSIIYVGSTLSDIGTANAASYIISKHAVLGLMRATCQDLAARKIHTCCIAPGFTDTEMLRSHIGESSEVMASITQRVCLNRLADPIEIARLIYFAAENPVVNGSLLHANLGQRD